ncbi:carbohydrate ABC transporter permease [Actinoplanes xinjiangensis]|jgi:multiple sugar transport system permease protein|uniref:Carbohydrate ABC transporter membrane protein 2 (CUT1 family) n=1 Tax=Actinoplanes xinjiangensis TaxID=512350 RepID=A0A316F7G4_9ACTN|nr:carbohydrate ABC transporter permease [Actinoplanes xinjiangensis]PWK42645.1 carbohydrate ABC transporter membrane protein 2 (CUT1 family) [Actinoplanes xinjiangensis]GIF38206.1 transporter [Actinoplanes xinjiangensis]
MDRASVEMRVLRVLRPIVITVLAVITLFPFLYMLLLSVRPIEELLQHPGRLWLGPSEWTLRTYREVLTPTEDGGQGFLRLLTNSAIVSVAATLLTLLVSIPGAYAVARLRFFGRRQVHFLFLAVYLFPSILLAIPLFVLFTRLGLRGSLGGLTLVYIAQTVPVSIYMLRNYLTTIPASLEEAAAVDGSGRLQTLRKVVLPLAAPAVMANALYVFMIAWNEFLFALLFLVEDRADWTVSLGLAQLSGGIEVSKTVLMAGSVVLTLPILIIFFAAERLLTEGLTAGADKG